MPSNSVLSAVPSAGARDAPQPLPRPSAAAGRPSRAHERCFAIGLRFSCFMRPPVYKRDLQSEVRARIPLRFGTRQL